MGLNHTKAGSYLPIMAGALLFTLPVFAQQYTSNDLTPSTSTSAVLNGGSVGKLVGANNLNRAILHSGNQGSHIELHPLTGYSSSMAMASDDTDQCGYAYFAQIIGINLGGIHAVKWSGTADSLVDLNNATGMMWSYCLGTHGGQQVGYGENLQYTVTTQNAFVWENGQATNLHPAVGFPYSKALGVRNRQQVGYGSTIPYPDNGQYYYHDGSRGLLWTGTAASFVELTPVGFTASEALATNGAQQGGWVFNALPTKSEHAALWSGSAASFVDMHPAGYSDSRILALNATQQVGDGWVGPMNGLGSVRHALLWNGSAQSVVDLNQYLPVGYTHGMATGIDANGNVIGYAYNTAAIYDFAPVPLDAIAVVFAPGQGAATSLTGFTFSSATPVPGAVFQGTVTLGAPAPDGGALVTFSSNNAALLAAPAPVTIPAGQTSATFSMSSALLAAVSPRPIAVKLIASYGVATRPAIVTVTPVVNLTSVSVNPVEGGFGTTGLIALNIPAQGAGAVISLSSSNPALVLPATVTVPALYSAVDFTATTSAVTAATSVSVTATYKGLSVATTVALSPTPVTSLTTITLPLTVGGQTATGTISVNNFPRNAGGAVITLTSSDTRVLQVPVSVTIPQFAYSVTFPVTTNVVTGTKGVTVKASFGGSNASVNVSVVPIPTITIVQADYFTDTHIFKVAATSLVTNAVFTFGTDPQAGSIGAMQFELGQWKGATSLATAPAFATVWSSDGGQASLAVTQKLSTAGGGGGGGTSSTFKLTVTKAGKGTVITNPGGIACGVGGGGCSASFPANTSVTLTATPDAGAVWNGWSGACTGTSLSCTVVLSADKSVTATFK